MGVPLFTRPRRDRRPKPVVAPIRLAAPMVVPPPTVSPPGPDVPVVVSGDVIASSWGIAVADDLAELWRVADEVWVGSSAPTGAGVELWYDTSATTPGGPDSASMSGPTIDTGELYRIIMFSDGTVRAIPFDATTPLTPTGLTLTPRINSVNVTWSAAAGASSYRVYRNPGGLIATTTVTHYRDSNVTVGQTYLYTVQAVNNYGLRSPETASVSTFIDPTLNVAPTVKIRAWPPTIALGNRALIRINATDVDGQTLASILGTDVGSLVATADPTVWILIPS